MSGIFQPIRKWKRLTNPLKTPTVKADFVHVNRWMKTINRRLSGPEGHKLLLKKMGDVLGTVIRRTAVVSGRARSGWWSFYESTGRRGPSLRDISEVSRDTPPEIKEHMVALGRLESQTIKALAAGGLSFVTVINAVPYIVKLEYGSPGYRRRQAPLGMVRRTVLEEQKKMLEETDALVSKIAITSM